MKERTRHLKIGFGVLSETNVREVFARFQEEFGYRIIESKTKFPDYILEDKDGNRVRAEVEFRASDFKKHGHSTEDCDLIICWYNDWPDCPIKILELCRFIEQPYWDVSLSRGELSELPEIISKIKELVKKRDHVFNELGYVMEDLDEFIRRNDHKAITERRSTKYHTHIISCRRKDWPSRHEVTLKVDLKKGVIEIKGYLTPDILNAYGREGLCQLVDEVKNAGFLIGDYELRPLGVEELLTKTEEGGGAYIFRSHDLIEIGGKSSWEIAEMLGNEVLELLNFMDNKRLVKTVSEE
ncbi:hypothetical protein DRO32_04765 [Candidatus Bathyarchaeota archaeon]|nr:MAG: hypothetical protein DRO32_04765 [Candidatus Bathyarchaeota archaeon]